MVQIQVQQCKMLSAALGQRKRLAEPRRKHRTVGQARQRIKVDQLADTLFIALAFGHIFLHGQVVRDPPLLIVQRRNDGRLIVLTTVLAAVEKLPPPGTPR
ncbi:hypothetical protein D3C72_2181670 [compost metagenome]